MFDDGSIQEIVVWRVPTPVPPRSHCFKYRLFCGFAGRRLIGYDNERGNGGGKRLELLRHVRQNQAASVAEPARALRRDYKRVHEDVGLLVAAGLLDRTEAGGLCSTYDEIRTLISLVPAV